VAVASWTLVAASGDQTVEPALSESAEENAELQNLLLQLLFHG
jgi:hypothetical protein